LNEEIKAIFKKEQLMQTVHHLHPVTLFTKSKICSPDGSIVHYLLLVCMFLNCPYARDKAFYRDAAQSRRHERWGRMMSLHLRKPTHLATIERKGL
jgi:hypothetical protein